MLVPPSSEIAAVCNTQDFHALVERIKRDLQVTIIAAPKNPNGGASLSPTVEYSFKFKCQRSNVDYLGAAREMLEQFLMNRNIHVYPSATAHTHKRGDSFTDAFPHFDSKVLSAAKTRGHHGMFSSERYCLRSGSHLPSESADLTRPPSDLMGDRRLRLANSVPDVKALFNSPSYLYNLEDEDPASFVPAPNPGEYWPPMAPIVSTYSYSHCTKC